MADGRKAFSFSARQLSISSSKEPPDTWGVYPDFISYLAAQRAVYRYAVILSGNVVQCDIDGNQCAHDSHSAEMKQRYMTASDAQSAADPVRSDTPGRI